MKKLSFRSSTWGDWEAMYLDSVKVAEGHSLDLYEVLEKLGISFDYEEVEVEEDDPCAAFPEKLETPKEGETDLEFACRMLHEEIGPQKTNWVKAVAPYPEKGSIVLYVKNKSAIKKAPDEFRGFPVKAVVSGLCSPCGKDVLK